MIHCKAYLPHQSPLRLKKSGRDLLIVSADPLDCGNGASEKRDLALTDEEFTQ